MLFSIIPWIDEFALPYSKCPRPWSSQDRRRRRETCITLRSTTTASIANGLVTSPGLPSRREVYRKILSLPKFPTLSETDQEYIVGPH